jgi:hypothetical protein
MADGSNPNSRSGHGNRLVTDQAVFYAMAVVLWAVVFALQAWQVSTSVEIRERVARIEAMLFPLSPAPAFRSDRR